MNAMIAWLREFLFGRWLFVTADCYVAIDGAPFFIAEGEEFHSWSRVVRQYPSCFSVEPPAHGQLRAI